MMNIDENFEELKYHRCTYEQSNLKRRFSMAIIQE